MNAVEVAVAMVGGAICGVFQQMNMCGLELIVGNLGNEVVNQVIIIGMRMKDHTQKHGAVGNISGEAQN